VAVAGHSMEPALRVGDGEVTVMGDRRDHSTDSRYFGDVPLSDVVGRAAFRYAPLGRAGRVRS
jgi:signal peptidase I